MRTPKEREAQGLPTEGAPKRKRGRPRKEQPVVTEPEPTITKIDDATGDIHELSVDGELHDVWERRMLNPHHIPSHPIHLKTPGQHIRWMNVSNNGRYQRARYEQGWVPVHKDELVDEKEIYGATFSIEGWVCKGERQGEMLMKIPLAIYRKICQAKFDEVKRSNKRIKDNMQQGAARHFGEKYNQNRGDEIAETVNDLKGTVQFGAEAVAPDEEDFSTIRRGFGEQE